MHTYFCTSFDCHCHTARNWKARMHA